MAGAILADLGADVTRVEIEGFEDPFLADHDEPAFGAWARNLAANKKSIKVKKEDEESIASIINASDVVLCPPSRFFKRLMGKEMEKDKSPLFIEIIGGSGKQKFLHDLNALFLTKSFRLHLEQSKEPSPPYLPFAGVIFAQQIALETMAGHIEKKSNPNAANRKVYLDQAAQGVLDKLWAPELEGRESGKFLHNGKFPCYNVYRTKDGGFAGVAAVESRFWSEFSDIFGLELTMDDRFDASGKTGQKLTDMFLSYKTNELEEKIGERDICVNVFARKQKD